MRVWWRRERSCGGKIDEELEEGMEACTSGKVPLEKTLGTSLALRLKMFRFNYSHQQAGLSASTITNNDEFATDFSHGGCWDRMLGEDRREDGRLTGSVEMDVIREKWSTRVE